MGPAFKVVIAVAVGLLILRVGIAVLRMFAQPVAEPPPAASCARSSSCTAATSAAPRSA